MLHALLKLLRFWESKDFKPCLYSVKLTETEHKYEINIDYKVCEVVARLTSKHDFTHEISITNYCLKNTHKYYTWTLAFWSI